MLRAEQIVAERGETPEPESPVLSVLDREEPAHGAMHVHSRLPKFV